MQKIQLILFLTEYGIIALTTFICLIMAMGVWFKGNKLRLMLCITGVFIASLLWPLVWLIFIVTIGLAVLCGIWIILSDL